MKTLRFIGVAIIAIIISTNLISCSDNEEATFISLDENTPLDDTIFTFTEEGGEKTISFKFNDKEWAVFPLYQATNWVSYTPKQGNTGDNTITFKILKNIGPYRRYDFTLASVNDGSKSCCITIQQEEADDISGVYTINMEAGTLPGIISEEYDYISKITKLTLKGNLNGTDILLLRKMLCELSGVYYGALSVLDLANANIVEGGEDYDAAHNVEHYTSNDEIGESMFAFSFVNATDVLTSIILPNSIKVIGSYAFQGREKLTSIIIPNNVTTIGDNAFYNCTKLTSLVIGEKVKEIGEWAFKATKLKEIHIKALAPPTIEHDTFSDYAYSSATLYVPKGSKKVYQNANVWKEFHNIIEE